MRSKKTKDNLENKETLDFLIEMTELLKASDALIGRNNDIFAIDTSKAPQLLADENEDLSTLFMKRQLIIDQEHSFASMHIVTKTMKANEILFFDVADSLSPKNHQYNESFPFLDEVRHWFLNIPEFTENERSNYEKIYQKAKEEMNKIIHENVNQMFIAILSGIHTSNYSRKKK